MQRSRTFFLAFCILLATAGAAMASTSGTHDLPWSDFAFRIGNLILFVGLFTYFFGKKIVGFLKGRTENIANELSTLEQRKAEAEKSLEEMGKRIGDLEQERKKILADYEAQGEAIKAAIVAQAEKSAAQIIAQAKASARNEAQVAMDAMRDELAERITEAAEKILAERLTESEHVKLIDNYVKKVVLN